MHNFLYIRDINHVIYFTSIICVKKFFYNVSGLCPIICKVTIKVIVTSLPKKKNNTIISKVIRKITSNELLPFPEYIYFVYITIIKK